MPIMIGLEHLSTELFTSILDLLTSQRDFNALSRTSRTLYHLVTPRLYHSWSYQGLSQELKPLRQFLETINWRPDLGAYVKELDLREWGDCPRLEEHVGDFWEGHEGREAEKERIKKEREKGTLMDDTIFEEDDEDGDYNWEGTDPESGGSDWDDEGLDDFDDRIDEGELETLGPTLVQRGGDMNDVYRKMGRLMKFEDEDQVLHYANILFEEDEDELVILLLSKLPNLQKMWMVMPEQYDLKRNVLCKFLGNNALLASCGILQKLETFYVCSPMHLGGNGHREYDLELQRLFPFMRLPSMRNLYTLTAHTTDDYGNNPRINWEALRDTSNITTLVYDDSELPRDELTDSLSIPKALKSFRWTGESSCYSVGSCYPPWQRNFWQALRKHQNSLEYMYLDVRSKDCREAGHHGNPEARMESVRRVYGDAYAEKWEKARLPNDAVLIGDLKGFKKLKTMAIDSTSLCGHPRWVPGQPLIETLPPNLEELTLFVTIAGSTPLHPASFDNRIWYNYLLELLSKRRNDFSQFRRLHIRAIWKNDASLPWHERDREGWPERRIDFLFEEICTICKENRVEVSVDYASEGGNTIIPYFLEQMKVRNPGRDF